MSILKPIADDKQEKRGWRLKLNGEPVDKVTSFQLENDRFGTLDYGETSAGYDSWCFEEVGGGGSVIVPYVILNAALYIGLVQQERYTVGGKIWNLPRGFLDPGETHFEAAQREAGQEFRFNLADRFTKLAGSPTNPNSAFFVTLGDDEGVRFYGLEIKADEVELVETLEYGQVFRLQDRVIKPVSRVGELIFDCSFAPYKQALQSSDMFTVAGVGRLIPKVMLVATEIS